MRWPVQHEFVVGMSRSNRPFHSDSVAGLEDSDTNKQWIAMRAGLNPDAFEKLAQPLATRILRVSLQTQSAVNADASYYDAIIKAVDAPHIAANVRGQAGKSHSSGADVGAVPPADHGNRRSAAPGDPAGE